MAHRPSPCDCHQPGGDRRSFLRNVGAGFFTMGLTDLLRASGHVVPVTEDPLAPKRPHFPPRAKRIVFLFMHGGPSQVDTFDYKPLLQRGHGKPLPFAKPRVTFAETGNLMASPFRFAQHGESGAWVSELFPHLAQCADDLCFVKSLHGSNDAHGGALLKIHTGSDTFVRPSIGSWSLYGLGSESQDLPGFVTICPTLGHGGVNNWSSAFLPAVYQGTPLGNASVPARQAAVEHLKNSHWNEDVQRAQLAFLRDQDGAHATARGGDDALQARIRSFELAFRMQMTAPRVLDIDNETNVVKKLYGLDDAKTENFGRQCLMARRLLEAGVRFVQVTHSYKWDQHNNLEPDHRKNAREVDQPIAALITDLKRLGMLEDTLLWWGGEFGRTPTTEGGTGRDHNPHGFTHFFAGGGTRPGHSHGATDDYGYYSAEDKVHVHDLHATILHLLGLDHEKLTYRYAGRDFRLTDVEGNVVSGMLAR